MNILKLGLPKGSLEEATYNLFRKAGFNIRVSSRSYYPTVDDEELEIVLYRPQEMSRYVEDGVVDAALTGYDWILENNSDVTEVCDLRMLNRPKDRSVGYLPLMTVRKLKVLKI